MDGWTAGRTQAQIQDFFVRGRGGGGSRPDGQNTGSAHGTNTYVRTYVYRHTSMHTHVKTGTWMFMHSQTDGHTCTCIDGKLKDRLFKTCIIMYRDNVRNIQLRACRGIHERVIILKISLENEWFGPIETNLFHFHRISKKTGGGGMEGFEKTPWTQTGSTTAYTCMLMHRHSGCIKHEHATRMYFKKCMGRVVLWIWAELSYKLGPSWHWSSFMWAELAWAELVLGRVVRNSYTWPISATC